MAYLFLYFPFFFFLLSFFHTYIFWLIIYYKVLWTFSLFNSRISNSLYFLCLWIHLLDQICCWVSRRKFSSVTIFFCSKTCFYTVQISIDILIFVQNLFCSKFCFIISNHYLFSLRSPRFQNIIILDSLSHNQICSWFLIYFVLVMFPYCLLPLWPSFPPLSWVISLWEKKSLFIVWLCMGELSFSNQPGQGFWGGRLLKPFLGACDFSRPLHVIFQLSRFFFLKFIIYCFLWCLPTTLRVVWCCNEV